MLTPHLSVPSLDGLSNKAPAIFVTPGIINAPLSEFAQNHSHLAPPDDLRLQSFSCGDESSDVRFFFFFSFAESWPSHMACCSPEGMRKIFGVVRGRRESRSYAFAPAKRQCMRGASLNEFCCPAISQPISVIWFVTW